MYFEVSRKDLLNPLKMMIGVVELRQTTPILSHILVRVENNGLHFTATDTEVEIACFLPLEESLSTENEGETTLPARKLFDICRSLSDNQSVQLVTDDNQATIKAGKSKFKLQTLLPEDFPNSPEIRPTIEFSLSQPVLKNILQKTAFCVAANDVRYYLTGLLLEIDENQIAFVGTDGHRMAVTQYAFDVADQIKRIEQPELNELEDDDNMEDDDGKPQVIIPRKAVSELSKLLSDQEDSQIHIAFDANHIEFKISESLIIRSKLIDGTFPDWRAVVPKDSPRIVTVQALKLKQALIRVSILSNEKYKGIRFKLTKNLLTIKSKNAYQEEAEEVLDVEYEGDELEIGFNGVYMLDVLNISANKIHLCFGKDENSSLLIKEENNNENQYIVMPMRL